MNIRNMALLSHFIGLPDEITLKIAIFQRSYRHLTVVL